MFVGSKTRLSEKVREKKKKERATKWKTVRKVFSFKHLTNLDSPWLVFNTRQKLLQNNNSVLSDFQGHVIARIQLKCDLEVT